MKKLYVTILLLLGILEFAGAQLQSSVGTNAVCPGERVRFTCNVSSSTHDWRINNGSAEQAIGIVFPSTPTRTNLGFELTIVDPTASPITSTATVTTSTVLNGTVIVCNNGLLPPNRLVQNTTVNIIGPPSIPSLSCVDLSEDVNGSVSVGMSWTLSGGDSADYYLINISTNDPQPPYGGLLNITTPSVTQRELTGFQAGYEYTIKIRGVNCGSQEGSESEPLTITPNVPVTPIATVCAEYDGTLQTIESTWDEVDPVTVSADCVNRQDIRASYELSYTSSSGTTITTCSLDGTDCSNGVCRHELQENVTDSRCQPPEPQFNNESLSLTVTAKNIVGRSNPDVSRNISSMNAALWVDVDSTNPASVIVECTFEPDYTCTIDYGSDSSYTNLVYRDNSTTLEQVTTITLSKEVERDTIYYFIVSAESSSLCVRVRGTFRTDCTVSDLVVTAVQNGMVETRCGGRSSLPISNGVVCYNGTTAMSEAVYICDGNSLIMGGATRVCQSDGFWNGNIPLCVPVVVLALSVAGGVGAIVAIVVVIIDSVAVVIVMVLIVMKFEHRSVLNIPMVVILCLSVFGIPLAILWNCFKESDKRFSPYVIVIIVLLCLTVIGIPVALMISVWFFKKPDTCDWESESPFSNSPEITTISGSISGLIIAMIVVLCLSVIGIPLAIWIGVCYFKKADKKSSIAYTFAGAVGATGGAHPTPNGTGFTCCVIVTIVFLCPTVIGIPLAVIIAVWLCKNDDDTCDFESVSPFSYSPEVTTISDSTSDDTKGTDRSHDHELKGVSKKKEEEALSTLQHGKPPTSPDPLLTDKTYGTLGEHSEEAGDQHSQTRHGVMPYAVPNPEDPTYSHFNEGEGGGGGQEEHSRIQRGKPPIAVPNPSDPNYSHLKQGTQGASHPPAEELQYNVVANAPRYQPSQKGEKEGKGKRKRQK